ncbi:hypothetical protein BKA70DRAFT_1090714 [Coprinopsis sp. MPI-PUGE-AT-0042]|nr:hypothetical protein BKA70DRAFT_1090714 [Coprinopsis sp. MPI-PUGE-AT-0042]
MLYTVPILLLAVLLLVPWLAFRIYGITIRLSGVNLRPFTLKGLYFRRKGHLEMSVGSLILRPTLPRPTSPHWMLVTIEDASIEGNPPFKARCTRLDVTMWFLPTTFLYTAGPIVTAKVHGFTIDVDHSSREPWWLRDIRLNLTETIMKGNTTRIHDIKTKMWFWKPASPPRPTAVKKREVAEEHESVGVQADQFEEVDGSGIETPDAYLSDTDSFVEDEEDLGKVLDETESRVRASVFQLFVRNLVNHRMYSMGKIDVEVKRPWSAPPLPKAPTVTEDGAWPGSLLVRLENCKWTKLPRIDEKPRNVVQYVVTGFTEFAKALWRDPMLFVDLDVRSCEMNYKEFRLRDADVMMESAKMVHQAYASLSNTQSQALHEFAWDLFATGVASAFRASTELQEQDPGIPHVKERVEAFTDRTGKYHPRDPPRGMN